MIRPAARNSAQASAATKMTIIVPRSTGLFMSRWILTRATAVAPAAICLPKRHSIGWLPRAFERFQNGRRVVPGRLRFLGAVGQLIPLALCGQKDRPLDVASRLYARESERRAVFVVDHKAVLAGTMFRE